MKKIFMLLALSLALVSCKGASSPDTSKEANDTKKEVTQTAKDDSKKTVTVTTSFIADMVNELVGDKVNVEMIIPAGEDPHLYVAKPEDLTKLKEADLVLYHGLHFEGKMVEALEAVGYPITQNFDESKIGKMDEGGTEVIDPHFWFDISLYKQAFSNTSAKLQELLKDDPETVAKIKENEKAYLAKLDDLDSYIKKRISEINPESRYLITPHDAFNYFSRAYGMQVMAPQGVSTDSEVSNKDLEDTAKFIAEKKIKAIFAESTTNPERMEKLREVVKANGFDVKVVSGDGQELFSDSLAKKGEPCDNYIDMYKHNVDLMVENLK